MLDQSYTAKNFRRLLRPADFSSTKHNLPGEKAPLDAYLAKVEKRYRDGLVDIGSLIATSIRGRTAYMASDFETDIVLRKLNDNIRRLYSISQPNRTDIVRQLINLLSDGTPIQLFRRDIKSFYESLPRRDVIGKVFRDYLLGMESKNLLGQLFESPALSGLCGFPRGLGLSATLTELSMRTLDKAMRSCDGVLYYARYVDDIVILSFKNGTSIDELLQNQLMSMGLSLNQDKSPAPVQLPGKARNYCDCAERCRCDNSIEYLGYQLAFPKPPIGWDKKRRGRFVCVSLSKSKAQRIRSRAARAFADYCSSSSFHLLERRIAYLTSNYPLPLNKFKKRLKGGVYYHYPLIRDLDIFRELDGYLRSLIFAKNGTLGQKLKIQLTNPQRQALKTYSFVSGFANRYYVDLTQQDLSDIKRCWRYD